MAMLWVGEDSSSLKPLPLDPSTLEWGLQDVSADDAGRDMSPDATMHKQRIAQKRKIKLAWQNPTASNVSAILQAFNPEYVWVRYPDAMAGTLQTRRFYVGDRTAPFRWYNLPDLGTRFSELGFDIIEV